ncbi:MAG: abortive infection family protein [Terriglobales bacterium]
MAKPPNYLDFLVALDDHIFNSNLDYVQDWSELHRIAQDTGLETRELPQAARWTGELYNHEYLALEARGFGAQNNLHRGGFTDQDLQQLRDFRITPLGREEADRVRRQQRESDTDAVLGIRFQDLDQLAASDPQRRAIETPWRQLRTALESEHWPAVIGSAKDLVEAACKVAIALAGTDPPTGDELPTLARKALEAIDGDAADDLAKRLMSAVQQLAHLRNTVGTGHGRGDQPEVSRRTGRLAASTALAVAEYVLSAGHERAA